MTIIYRHEASEVFKNFATYNGLIFYEDFDINFVKYKGMFECPNNNGDKTVTFSVYEDELTLEFIEKTIDLVINTLLKENIK